MVLSLSLAGIAFCGGDDIIVYGLNYLNIKQNYY